MTVNLKVKTKAGHIQTIVVEELMEIDGKPYELADSLEDRVLALEQAMTQVVEFLNKPPDSPIDERTG